MSSKKSEKRKKDNLSPTQNETKKMKHEVTDTNIDSEEKENKFDSASLSDTEEYDPNVHDVLTEYEIERRRNIEENMNMLMQLDLTKAKTELRQVGKSPRRIGLIKSRSTKSSPDGLARRVSMRLQRVEPNGTPLPPLPLSLPKRDEWARKPEGDLPMESKNEIENGLVTQSLNEWAALSSKTQGGCNTKKEEEEEEEEMSEKKQKYTSMLSSLTVHSNHVGKVVPDRIYSSAVHPSEEKILACVGDKRGRLGIWDVGCTSLPQNGVVLFEPHSAVINCLKFSPLNDTQLFTCSYDGTIRCGDLNKQVFQDILSTAEEDDIRFNSFAFPCGDQNVLLVAVSNGCVFQVDTRERRKSASYLVNENSVRCVDCHPVNSNLLATCGYNGTVAIWDLRNMKSKGSKSVDRMHPTRVCHSVSFSPKSGEKILSISMDDTIRVGNLDGCGKVTSSTIISHNNHTGRWLTPFRPVWDPKHDDLFLCGSMDSLRQLDAFTSDGSKRAFYHMTHENFTTIASINAIHPTRNIVVSCNSSGKVSVWTEGDEK